MSEDAAARLRTAFDLHTAGVRMKRQSLRNRHPEAPEAEIAAMLRAWMQHRPGAEFGDAVGEPVPWPREPSKAASNKSSKEPDEI